MCMSYCCNQESSPDLSLTELTGATSREASTVTMADKLTPDPTSSTLLSGSAVCTSRCCLDSLEVFQVKDETVINKTKKVQGQRSWRFCCDWYTTYPWLVLCITRLKAFCIYCRYCDTRSMLKDSKLSDSAFISSGFNN